MPAVPERCRAEGSWVPWLLYAHQVLPPICQWECVEYVADANTAGEKQGMIIIGHWVSEDEGMRVCADWLKTFVSEVPVQWIPAGDPFWRP